MKNVHFSKQDQKSKKVEKVESFAVTYSPELNKQTSIIHNVFTPGPIALFRSTKKTSTYLIRMKLQPLEKAFVFKKYGKSRNEGCLIIEETDTFTSTATGESFKINHMLDCYDTA